MKFSYRLSEDQAVLEIPYGDGSLAISMPEANLAEMLIPNEVPERDEDEIITRALDNPIGNPRLEELVKPGQKIVVICDDITRPTPTDRLISPVVQRLNSAGIPDGDISIVMALGSHRPMTEPEMVKKVGRDIYSRIRVYNSEFKDSRGLVDLGEAPGGIRVRADRRAMEADVRVGIGGILPHPAVGWSGGGKIIYPGVTAEDTVARYHFLHGSAGWNMFGAEDCPVRLQMEQWVDTVGLHFIVNAVTTPKGRLYEVVAGHYVAAHRAGVKFAKEVFGVRCRGKVDIAVVSGYPADADFWQATKGVLSGDHIVKDGGTLILLAACPEGIGPHHDYIRHIGSDDPDELLKGVGSMSGEAALTAAVAATVARIRQRIRLALVSHGIARKDAQEGQFEFFESAQEALDVALGRYGPAAKVSIIPMGSETFPMLAAS